MMTSIQSASLLEKYDTSAFTQRLFQRDQAATTTPAATDFGHLFANVDLSTTASNTAQQNFFADLNTTRAEEYGLTYAANGSAAPPTANTILVGYG